MIALSEQIIANNYGNATDRHLDRRRVIHSINSVVLKVRLSEEADSRSFGAAAPARYKNGSGVSLTPPQAKVESRTSWHREG
jgi:hypothetical protein